MDLWIEALLARRQLAAGGQARVSSIKENSAWNLEQRERSLRPTEYDKKPRPQIQFGSGE
jgi:hypothetical protein